MTTRAKRLVQLDRWAERLALLATCLLPLALLHARAGAEILIGFVDALFLLHVWAVRDGTWLRTAFVLTAGFWWAWLVLCSAIGTGGLGLALAAVRLPLLAVALSHWVLRHAVRRRRLWWVLAASAVWIVLQCWQQVLTGTNLFGQPRWGDGALTGPFHKPRAGPELALLLFPVAVFLTVPGGARRAGMPPLLAFAIFGAGFSTIVLIGQRMPLGLSLLGFLLLALLVRRLRAWLLAAAACGGAVLLAMPRLTPAAYDKLVTHTREQLGDFRHSAYGEIFAHAGRMIGAHPWFGQGMDAFRRACAQAGRNDLACNLHPHNYYLEAAVNGGVPLLLLFFALAVAALVWLQRSRAQGVFVGAVLAFWPLATTSAFTSIPNAGWIFLLLGLGFADHSSISRKNWSASSS